jgi:hypothetical protein
MILFIIHIFIKGTGAAGMAMALYGADVTVTDLEEVLLKTFKCKLIFLLFGF